MFVLATIEFLTTQLWIESYRGPKKLPSKGKGSLFLRKRMNFWKNSEFPNFRSKKFSCKIFSIRNDNLGGYFRSKKFCRKKSQNFSLKRGGGGVKGCSEIFRKFIHFREDGLPSGRYVYRLNPSRINLRKQSSDRPFKCLNLHEHA